MKITGFETIPIRGRSMVLKMYTDEGLVGFGEPMNYEHWRPVAQAVDDMAEYLVGRDPCRSKTTGRRCSDPVTAGVCRCWLVR